MSVYGEPSNRESLSQTVLQAAEVARAKLDLIPFAKQENIDFEEYHHDFELTWWYECRENGCFYHCIVERASYNERLVAHNQEELVNVFVEAAVRDYAFDYECHNRHNYISHMRQVHTIKEFCYHFIDGRKCYEDYYDDYGSIAYSLMDDYGDMCKKIVISNTKDDVIAKAVNYILNKEYCDYPYGGLKSWKGGLFKAHEKMKIVAKAFPEECKRFYYLENLFEGAMKNLEE